MLGKEIQVSIIVLNYNKWEYLFPCLESIFTLQNISYQIIIVDNASENDSVSRIFSYFNCQQNLSKETFITKKKYLHELNEYDHLIFVVDLTLLHKFHV